MKVNIKKKFDCNIEKIWDIITDNSDYSWRSDLSRIEIIDEYHFVEYTKNNYPTYFTIISKKRLKEYQFLVENTNMKGNWIGCLRELPNGEVEFDCTEEVEVANVMMKLLARPYLKSQQRRYMKDLDKRLRKE